MKKNLIILSILLLVLALSFQNCGEIHVATGGMQDDISSNPGPTSIKTALSLVLFENPVKIQGYELNASTNKYALKYTVTPSGAVSKMGKLEDVTSDNIEDFYVLKSQVVASPVYHNEYQFQIYSGADGTPVGPSKDYTSVEIGYILDIQNIDTDSAAEIVTYKYTGVGSSYETMVYTLDKTLKRKSVLPMQATYTVLGISSCILSLTYIMDDVNGDGFKDFVYYYAATLSPTAPYTYERLDIIVSGKTLDTQHPLFEKRTNRITTAPLVTKFYFVKTNSKLLFLENSSTREGKIYDTNVSTLTTPLATFPVHTTTYTEDFFSDVLSSANIEINNKLYINQCPSAAPLNGQCRMTSYEINNYPDTTQFVAEDVAESVGWSSTSHYYNFQYEVFKNSTSNFVAMELGKDQVNRKYVIYDMSAQKLLLNVDMNITGFITPYTSYRSAIKFIQLTEK